MSRRLTCVGGCGYTEVVPDEGNLGGLVCTDCQQRGTTIISKTTYTFTVLHRTDEPFTEGLTEAMARSYDGHAVGWETNEVTESVPDDKVSDELVAIGNDGTFFDYDLGLED